MDKNYLKNQIEIEIWNLERLLKELIEINKNISDNPNFIETRAAGSILHDFYCGVEKIFERIFLFFYKNLPKAEDWHNELLLKMASPIDKIGIAVISNELMQKLKDYLRFRHLFRNIYGFELKWERFKNLSLSLPAILDDLKNNLKKFLISL